MSAGAGAGGDDFDTATRYLRGELDELDRTVFEERLLADDAVHRTVLAAEDELLDAHVAGTLDGPVRERLQARLLAEPGLRRRLDLARGLFARAARPDAAAAPARAASPRRLMRWAIPLVAAAIAAAVALILLSKEPPRQPAVVTLAMAAPTRGSVVPELALAAGTRTVRLVLDVPPAPPPSVTIAGPRGPVTAAPAAASADGLVVDVDAAALVPGIHDITVTAAGAPAVVFQLRIVRR
jgi:hypothetical protein